MPIVGAAISPADRCGKLLGDELEHEEILSRRIQRPGVFQKLQGGGGRLALTPLLLLVLELEADVPADVDFRGLERAHQLRAGALELDAIRAGRAQSFGAFERLRRRLIGREGQIADDVGFWRAAPHGGDVMAHVGERDLALMRIAEDIDPDAVADEDDVDADLGRGLRGGRVIGRDDDDLFAPTLHVGEMGGLWRHRGFPERVSPSALSLRLVGAGLWRPRNAHLLKSPGAFIAARKQRAKRGRRRDDPMAPHASPRGVDIPTITRAPGV